MANMGEFELLIQKLMSSDNDVRREAENVYNQWQQSPDILMAALLHLFKGTGDEVRGMCLVLLRPLLVKVADTESIWDKVTPQTKAMVTTELLNGLQNEKTENIRHKLCSAIAELATQTIPSGTWPELLPFMFNCTKSEIDYHRESALNIFSEMAANLGEQFRPYFNILQTVLHGGLTDPSIKVRVAALSATANFLQVLQEPNEMLLFQQLAPLMLETINAALNAHQEEEARSALELFVELAEVEPAFLKPSVNLLVDNMIAIASASQVEEDTRHLALEVIVTLAESKPAMIRKVPNLLPRLIPLVINLMLLIEDEPLDEWNNSREEDDEDVRSYEVGDEALDRLSIALGGKTLGSDLFTYIPTLLNNNNDWKHRHCGIMAISIAGEGCHKFLLPHLTQVMGMVLPKFADPHPRVRWAACNCIGQMATDFQPKFQEMFHSQVLPALTAVMEDAQNPRVQAHAASALINFCEDFSADLLHPYLDGLLSKLVLLLRGGRVSVQEQAITAVAAIADCAGDKFLKYYDLFIPFLKDVLWNAISKEHRKLRGKAMECISLIGVAVGKEKFFNDAKEVMDIMMKTQAANPDPDDPQVSFMQQAWARICKCLGQDFVPFLSIVMPSLLSAAGIKTDFKVYDLEQSDEYEEGWEYVTVGKKRVGINTATLDEKANACDMVYCYATELEEGFFPYVDPVVKLMAPLLKFYCHDGVRTAAVSCMPPLLECAAKYFAKIGAAQGADMMYVRNLFSYIFDHFKEGIQQEMDTDILAHMLETFVECLEIVGDNALNPTQFAATQEMVKQLILDYKERRQEHAEKRKAPDVDDEEEEKLDEETEKDEEILSQCADIIGRSAKYHKALFLSQIQSILPIAMEFLQPSKTPAERQAGLCIADDITEFLGKESIPLFPHFLPYVIQYISDENSTVRQAAVYGIGIFAQVGAEHFAPYVPDVLTRLNAVITHPDSRKEENVGATDNAIAAVGRICESQAAVVNLPQVLPLWLSYLPVKDDLIESKFVYNALCSFVEKHGSSILGHSFQNLTKVVSVFGEVLGTELVDDDITKRILNLLKQMQTQIPPEVLQNAWAGLSPDHQVRLQQALAKAQAQGQNI